MKAPHHTQSKLAAKLGFVLSTTDDEYVLSNDTQRYTDPDLKALLARVMADRTEGGSAKTNGARPDAKPRKPRPVKAVKVADEAEDEAEEEVEEEQPSGSIVKEKYKVAYADGSCGDAMALAFKAATWDAEAGQLDMKALAQVATANGVNLRRWSELNNGQKRMNLGNVLRGMLRHGTDVTIGGETFKGASNEEMEARAAKRKKSAKKGKVATKAKQPVAKKAKTVKRGARI